ncbi:phage tail length tape measure family protein [Crenalkalicoccus roseus]|uniref:phage tail length tape measure family protein n=1 Tax=Crenalkalicoccus roseus TaxID=1485588 RepID=UPI00108185F3|nr:phage tail length tape measure family protein [Crenalkalicoccus roseus]
MAQQTYSFRISAEGLEQFRAQIEAAAKGNEDLAKAWEKLRSTSPGLVSAMERAEQATDRAAQRMQGHAQAADKATQSTGFFSQALTQVSGQVRGFIDQINLGGVALSDFAARGTSSFSAINVAVAGTTAAFAALTTTVTLAVRAAEEFERLGLRTEAVVRATGGAAGYTAEQIRALAQDIARNTLASTEGVEAAAQKLLTFRSVAGETFERTLRAAQDLAAVGFGTIESAAVQLGKALESPAEGLSALTRVGVTFTAEQRRLIEAFVETGQVAEAQRVILEAVERQVGGAGAAEAGGLAGAFDTLGQNVQEFLVRIGNLGPLQLATAAINGLASAVGALDGALRGVIGFYSAEAVAERAVESARAGLATAQGGAAGSRRGTVRQGLVGLAADQAGDGAEAAYQQQIAAAARRLEEAEIRLIEIQERAERERAEVAQRGADERARIEAEAARGAYEALRESVDKRLGIERAYQREVSVIRRALAAGVVEQAEAERQLAAALERRDEALARMEARAVRAGGGRAGAPAQEYAFPSYADFVRSQDMLATEERRQQERVQRAIEQEEQRRQQAFDRTVARYSSQLAQGTVDALFEGTRRGEGFFTSLSQVFARGLRTALAAALDTQVFQPLLGQVLGGVLGGGATRLVGGGTVSQLGSMASLANAAGGGGLLDTLGLGGVGTALSGLLSTPLWSSFGASVAAPPLTAAQLAGNPFTALPPLSAATTGTVTLGGLLGGVGLGFGVGSGLNTLFGGSQTGGTIGSGLGAAAGAAIGSIIPGVGTLLGGLIGGSGGGLLGGLFGSRPGFQGGVVRFGVTEDGQFGVLGASGKRWDEAAARAQAQQQAAALNAELARRGLTIDASGAWSNQWMDRPGIILGEIGHGQANTTASIEAMANAVVSRLRSSNPNVQAALLRSTSFEAALGNADWVTQIYEPAVRAAAATSDLDRALAELHDRFHPLIERALSLGLATDALSAAWERAVQDAIAARDAAIAASDGALRVRGLRAAGQALEADMLAFDLAAAEERRRYQEQMRAWGLPAEEMAWRLVELERVLAEERLAIQRRYAEQAAAQEEATARQRLAGELQGLRTVAGQQGVLTGWLDQAALASPALAPAARLAEAQRQFAAARDAALAAGVLDADLGAVTSAASGLLSAGRSFYGQASAEGAALERWVRASVEQLGAALDLPAFGGDLERSLAAAMRPLEDEMGALREEVARLREELRTARLRAAA